MPTQISLYDRFLTLAAWALLLVLWVVSLLSYRALPDLIPIHFDYAGQITKYGSKVTLLFFPLTASFVIIGISLLMRYPQLFNTVRSTSAEGRALQVFYSERLLRWVNLSISAVFLLVVVFVHFTALATPGRSAVWLLPVVLVMTLAPATYYVTKIFRVS